MNQQKRIIFISCGQYSEAEKNLGMQTADLVRQLTPYQPYFAQNQTSLEGLTNHIFKALNDASGLIAIMHTRGQLETPSGTRIH